MSAAVLLELLTGPARESELVEALDGADQSGVNRRLHSLGQAGLVTQEAGKQRAPRRIWAVAHPAETEQLLDALISLSEAVAARDQEDRQDVRARIRQARARRLGIGAVPSERAE
jgi:DNA-binding HxlR family transcriptional regulator